jgi:two-component system sensor histidine kinase TctE
MKTKQNSVPFSLRYSLLLLVLVPQMLAWLVGSLAAWQISQNYHNEQRDNLMRSQLHIIAQALHTNEPQVQRLQNVERAVALMDDQEGSVNLHYRISTSDGKWLAGQKKTPDAPHIPIANAQPVFYDSTVNSRLRRFAAMAVPYETAENGQTVLIILSKESLHYQQRATHLSRKMLFPMAALAGLCCILLYFGVQRGLQPLRRLDREISGIESGNTKIIPIDDKAPVEVLAVTNALNHTLQRLNRQVDNEKRFINDAAHQLRTPLAGLISQAELSLQESDPQKLHDQIEKMHGAALRSSHLLQQMLSLARSEARTPAHLPDSYDLAALAREVAREWVPKSMALEKDLGYLGDDTAMVRGNNMLMREAINNLIDNALVYTDKNSIVNVSVRHAYNGQLPVIILEVADNGPGVAPEQLPEVFTRFWRADDQILGGCGLGLPLVDRVASQHGGVATAHNARPHGFIVRITIPKATDPQG